MSKRLIAAALALGITPFLAHAEPECTKADKSQWRDKQQFQQDLKDQGYKINVFKVTEGNCYEIYGWNKQDQKVEIYFNPVSGDVVKKEVAD